MAKGKDASLKNTKQELLDLIGDLQQEIEEREKQELKPEKVKEESRHKESVKTADAATEETATKGIDGLKSELSRMLAELAEKLTTETDRYRKIKEAITAKDRELKDIFEIERQAGTLAALIEAQARKKTSFDEEMAAAKERMDIEIRETREAWKKEKEAWIAEQKEREQEEKKRREREKEEWLYAFTREKEQEKNRFEDEKREREKELAAKIAELETRERAIAEKESRLKELEAKVAGFDAQIQGTVQRAIKETTERLATEHKAKSDLALKQHEGEKAVLATRIETLDQQLVEQKKQSEKLSTQLDMAYKKVEDIALKALESSGNAKTIAGINQMLGERASQK